MTHCGVRIFTVTAIGFIIAGCGHSAKQSETARAQHAQGAIPTPTISAISRPSPGESNNSVSNVSGAPSAITTPTTARSKAPDGAKYALDACRTWSSTAALAESGESAVRTREAIAAREAASAASADSRWLVLATAMADSVKLPAEMLTPEQEAAANRDLASISRECSTRGVKIAASASASAS